MPRLSWRPPTRRDLRQQIPGDSLITPPGHREALQQTDGSCGIVSLSRTPLAKGGLLLQNSSLPRLPKTRFMKRPALKNFRRIVVKVGSSLLIDSDAGEVRASWL